MAGDRARGGVGRVELAVPVGRVRHHHRRHLGRVAAQVGLADAVGRVGEGDGLAVRRQVAAGLDVVQALDGGVLRQVHLQDHMPCDVQPGLVVADGGGGNEAAVLADAHHLDHRPIERPQEAVAGHLRHVREVDVRVEHLALVDQPAAGRVGLIGQAQFDALGLGQGAVELGRGGGAGPQADAGVLLALGVQAGEAGGEGLGHRLGVAGGGEAAHAHMGPGRDEGGGRLGRHDAAGEARVADAVGGGHAQRVGRFWGVRPEGQARGDPGAASVIRVVTRSTGCEPLSGLRPARQCRAR